MQNKDINILGVGHNTIVYIDLVESCGYNVAGLFHFEQGRTGENYFGHEIVGTNEELFLSDISGKLFAISVGNNQIRSELYSRILSLGGLVPTIIHPSAVVSKYAKIIIVNAKLLEIGYGLLEALNIKILSIEDLLSYLKKLNNLKLNPTVKICHIPP